MGENESKSFPTFDSLDELVEFVETHSLADYWDSMPEAHFMDENESKTLPAFGSLDEFVEFFETHDMGDYWDSMPEAHFDVDIKRRRYLVAIDSDLASKLTTIAKERHTSTEALVDSWLREKVAQTS